MAESESSNRVVERVWRAMPDGVRHELESGLRPTDLQSLLIGVAEARTASVLPADLVARWRRDRFVQPAAGDPRRLSAMENQLWQLLPDDFAGVELSPVAPMGTCAAVAPVSQNRILTTMRLTEVISDLTNALAIEAAVRRGEQPSNRPVHLAASHRQLRTQTFGPGAAAHFKLFALVSSARDGGSAQTEANLLIQHLNFWIQVLETTVPHREPQIELSVFEQPIIKERLIDTVLPACHTDGVVRLVEQPGRERGRGYYQGLATRIAVDRGALEIGDGGLTNWTAQLTGNAKERCLVSCIAVERLIELAQPG